MNMKIQLPNGEKHILDESITIYEKLQVTIEFTEMYMDIILDNWESNSVRFFLDSLSNYLQWHKEPEEKGREDKYILSRKKMEKMVRFKKTSKSINFSDMKREHQEILGLEEVEK